MSWEFLIPGLATGLIFISLFIELLLHDRNKAKEIEFAIIRKQREVKKYQKEGNTKAMMKANKELMSLMGANFKLRMRTTLISLPLFLIFFWLFSGTLAVAPIYADSPQQLGVLLHNLGTAQHEATVSFVSDEIAVAGNSTLTTQLDEKGDPGDTQTLWWNVTAPAGKHTYTILLSMQNQSDNVSYTIKFVPGSSLFADFTPSPPSTLFDGSVEIRPLYKPVEINLFGIRVGWFIYYLATFFILSLLLSPVKNKVLWGHWKGVKHLEKLDREKNETAKE